MAQETVTFLELFFLGEVRRRSLMQIEAEVASGMGVKGLENLLSKVFPLVTKQHVR